jgi:microcystin degradation protein MlrC
MPRILVAECIEEVSTFNPLPSRYETFQLLRGNELLEFHHDVETEVCGALGVFAERSDVEVIPTYSARQFTSGGVLECDAFEKISDALLGALQDHAGRVDALYFCLHGAMSAEGELDPEGYLLTRAREILGPRVPIVMSLDLHGILTDRMAAIADAMTIFHTYPHVDFADCGRRAARLLLEMLEGKIHPVTARVTMPTLVRGDELITETGIYGESIRRVQAIERLDGVLSAGLMIGNPFTDVPELCCQAVVVTDGDADLATKHATELAEGFWPHRSKMQAQLVELDGAIEEARSIDGPVIFTDAADAPSSGASGDSNIILARLIEKGYTGTVLAPIVDPPAVEQAIAAGVGATIRVSVGGKMDPARFTPIEIEATVDMISRGQVYFESWNNWFNCGNTAVLKTENLTVIATTRPMHLFDRSLFLAHGQDPRRFDLIVVKSPHCQYRFFDEWAAKNFNIDVAGATSANLPTLGHTICQRPMCPMEENAELVITPRVTSSRCHLQE